MESPVSFFRMHGDHEPVRGTPLVWSPAFRRFGPAKAGTPNGRFMGSLLSLARIDWDHEQMLTRSCDCWVTTRRQLRGVLGRSRPTKNYHFHPPSQPQR